MLTRLCRIDVSKVMQTVVLGWQHWHWPTGCPHWLQYLACCRTFRGCRIFRGAVIVKGLVVADFIGTFCVVFCAFVADKSRFGRMRG
jgi:hypothetical protein